MSIEAAIAENTAAIRDLIAIFKAQALPVEAPKTKPAMGETKLTKAETPAPAAEAAPTSGEPAGAVQPTYEGHIKPLFLKIHGKDAKAAMAILAKLGVKKMPDLTSDRYPAAYRLMLDVARETGVEA